ncbi:PREDICTED: ras-related protein Rab-22A isoform X1 [Ceratosolen solmsi marchali]|uniref:Ras-related protein Rab-22A isoform X1 n=1 Tax=Ceratosolen solmsi marchali TaxID=326594 RepID=A0AAJ6YV53_9HYME|nr:PREDICTED: ras-related protein Rab-22A isoform X1 [Ceratosolen solmsi marchali]
MITVEGKVVLLGSQGVGKTSMINRYVNKSFNNNVNPTIGAAFFTCTINLDNAKVKFQVWDTAGQERFKSMAPMYYRNANAAFLVFDITEYNTFTSVKSWVTELKRNVEGTMVLILVGNKLDLADMRKVDSEECRKYAESIGASYYEISVLHDEGVEQVFLAASFGLLKLSTGEKDIVTTLKIYDFNNSEIKNSDVPLSEEVLVNMNIAHGIKEKPYLCC